MFVTTNGRPLASGTGTGTGRLNSTWLTIAEKKGEDDDLIKHSPGKSG